MPTNNKRGDPVPIVLFALWVIFNAKLNWEIAVTGILVTVFVYRFMCRYMDYSYKTDIAIIKNLPSGIKYVAVLMWEVFRSNIEVSGFVFRKHSEIKPQLIFFKTRLKSDAARVALANSITLTPGTITVSEEAGILGVHCLNSHMGEDMDNSDFVTILAKMEGTADHD